MFARRYSLARLPFARQGPREMYQRRGASNDNLSHRTIQLTNAQQRCQSQRFRLSLDRTDTPA